MLWIVLGVALAVAEIFTVVSLLTVLGMRPVLRRHFGRDSDAPTPVAEIAGTEALVLERVDAEHGMVKIDGEFWQDRALDAEQVIEPGERVRVVEIKGVTAMVWKE